MYEAYEDVYNYYLVLELCRGGELFDYVLDRNVLTESIAADFMV
jgi:hypothetical protein